MRSIRHGAQFLRLIQQFRGNFCRATHNQRIRISDFRVQRVFRRQDNVPARLFLQELHTPLADLVRYDDFHEAPSPCARFSRTAEVIQSSEPRVKCQMTEQAAKCGPL